MDTSEAIAAVAAALGVAVAAAALRRLNAGGGGGESGSGGGGGEVDPDAWVYMQDDTVEDEPASPPFSPKDAREDAEDWNRTLVEMEGSFEEEEDDTVVDRGDDYGEAEAEAEADADEDGAEEEEGGSPRRRMHLRKHHRRSWTHTNLDGTVEERIHKRESPYRDGKNTRIVKDL